MKYISLGTFDKSYIYFFIIYSIFVLLLLFTGSICGSDKEIRFQNNIILYNFFNNIGQILCFIPEKIIDKFFFKPKEKSNNLNNLFKREKQTLAIELIFNDFSYKLVYTDLIYICCASLFILIIDYSSLLIQMKEDYIIIILSEQYYFVILSLLIILSYLIYRI